MKPNSPPICAPRNSSTGSRANCSRMRPGSKATRRTGRLSPRAGTYSNTRARSGDIGSTSVTEALWQSTTRLILGSKRVQHCLESPRLEQQAVDLGHRLDRGELALQRADHPGEGLAEFAELVV